ncbi:hypothetical protein Dacsa_2594 [Dactylococcopsis salina PCC 8305]|uniref:Uncharacterized protein n=1 Tax=Dactylococcopsis salina (strain PCC 8305) TaxID=13035 RepID=K9YW94_DACS8|nr:hypothetical protein Dacsa_2594 [Dactylococcopsis salina PCC 8305]
MLKIASVVLLRVRYKIDTTVQSRYSKCVFES